MNLDALTDAGNLETLRDFPDPARHFFIHGDICNGGLVADLLQQHQIDTIVHFAAETHVDRSLHNPADFVRTNLLGTYTLLECARRFWAPDGEFARSGRRFHHISTDEVFGSLEPDDPPSTEQTAYAPRSPYAASKAGSDHLVRSFFLSWGLPATISLCTNNYGPRQFPEKLIPLAVLRALEGKTIPVYGDGRHIRDWLHVRDHCQGILAILRNGIPGETYNIGAGGQTANLDLVRMICDQLDELAPVSQSHRSLITFTRDRRGHDRRYALDTGKIRSELGWAPRTDFETGLRETLRWYLDHQDWIDGIRRNKTYRQWIRTNYPGEDGLP